MTCPFILTTCNLSEFYEINYQPLYVKTDIDKRIKLAFSYKTQLVVYCIGSQAHCLIYIEAITISLSVCVYRTFTTLMPGAWQRCIWAMGPRPVINNQTTAYSIGAVKLHLSVCSSPCLKWPNTQDNCCWLPPMIKSAGETLFQTKSDPERGS